MIKIIDLSDLDDQQYGEICRKRREIARIKQDRKIRRLVMQGKRRYGTPNKTGGKNVWQIEQERQRRKPDMSQWKMLDKYYRYPST